MRRLFTVMLGVGVATASIARMASADDAAEDKPSTEDEKEASDVDYAVPESPAFTFLGASPTQIAQPGTVKDLGVELANVVDAQGNVQQGFALSVRLLGLALDPTPAEAKAGFVKGWKYWLSKTQFSLGTVKAGGGESAMGEVSPTDAALGVRFSLIDRGDPWTDAEFRKELGEALKKCAPESPDDFLQDGEGTPPTAAPTAATTEPATTEPATTEPATTPPADPAAPAAVSQSEDDGSEDCVDELESFRTEYRDEHWNAFRLDLGAATGLRLPTSTLDDDMFSLGLMTWLVGAIPVTDLGSLVMQARYDMRREVDVKFQKTLSVGARAYFGGARLHVLGEAIEQFRLDDLDPMADDRDFDWTLGDEFRVTGTTWVAVGLGNALEDDEDVQILGNIRWVLSEKEHFSRP